MSRSAPRPSALSPVNLALLGVLLAVSLFGGLSLVWIQQQIGETASRIESQERELRDLERRSQYLAARIAEEQRPDVLLRRAGTTLKIPSTRQVVRVEREYAGDGTYTVRMIPFEQEGSVALRR